jgi:hypothetical protein
MWYGAHTEGVWWWGDERGGGQDRRRGARGLVSLMKEYARLGYNGVHGVGEDTFEAMWGRAFGIDSIDEPEPLLTGSSSMRLPSVT